MRMGLERRLALASAVAGVLLVFTGLSLLLVEGGLAPQGSYTLIAGTALLIASAILDPGAVTELTHSRRARFGSLSVVLTAVVVGILVAFNVIASRSTQALDLTRTGLYTLSDRSVVVTRQLDSELRVTGYFRPDQREDRRQVESLLNLYQQQSPHVRVRFVDPDQNAAEALSRGVTISGSVVLEYRNKPPVVLNLAQQREADVTGAILRLESERLPVICWAGGDGERDLKNTDQLNGYSLAADLIKTSNYQLQDVLISQQGVPSGCDVLAVVGVTRPLSDGSVKAVQEYLNGGGKLLLAIDPWVSRDGKALASVNAILKPYGVSFDGGLVVEGEASRHAENNPAVPVAVDYGPSPITKNLANRYTFFPEATAIGGQTTGDATSANLVTTSNKAYQILQQREKLDRQAADKAGPFVLMQTVEQPRPNDKKARLVLVGTAHFAENLTMPQYANGSNSELLLASLDWLSEQEALIALGPKPPRAQPLLLTGQDLIVDVVLTVLVLPALVVGAGLLVWARRRRAI